MAEFRIKIADFESKMADFHEKMESFLKLSYFMSHISYKIKPSAVDRERPTCRTCLLNMSSRLLTE